MSGQAVLSLRGRNAAEWLRPRAGPGLPGSPRRCRCTGPASPVRRPYDRSGVRTTSQVPVLPARCSRHPHSADAGRWPFAVERPGDCPCTERPGAGTDPPVPPRTARVTHLLTGDRCENVVSHDRTPGSPGRGTTSPETGDLGRRTDSAVRGDTTRPPRGHQTPDTCGPRSLCLDCHVVLPDRTQSRAVDGCRHSPLLHRYCCNGSGAAPPPRATRRDEPPRRPRAADPRRAVSDRVANAARRVRGRRDRGLEPQLSSRPAPAGAPGPSGIANAVPVPGTRTCGSERPSARPPAGEWHTAAFR